MYDDTKKLHDLIRDWFQLATPEEIENKIIAELRQAYQVGRADNATLTNSLHRRAQKCEGAELKLEALRISNKKEIAMYVQWYRDNNAYWREKTFRLQNYIDHIPWCFKWFVNIMRKINNE